MGDEGADGEVAVVFDGGDGEAAGGGIAGWWILVECWGGGGVVAWDVGIGVVTDLVGLVENLSRICREAALL